MTAAWAAPTDIEEFTEAVTWLLAHVVVVKKVWSKLDAQAQRKAFTVAGIASVDLIRDVLLAIDRGVANGETLGDFKKRVGRQLVDAWAGSVKTPGWRIETIYRTNVQQSYNAGRYHQMSEPVLTKVRPFWQYDAILDNRTTHICEKADGTILPVDHPWWKANYPPRHFNCRSIVRSLRRKQAERKGITKNPSKEPSQEGFGLTPDAGEWQPEVKKYPKEIRTELKQRLKRLKDRSLTPTPAPKTVAASA